MGSPPLSFLHLRPIERHRTYTEAAVPSNAESPFTRRAVGCARAVGAPEPPWVQRSIAAPTGAPDLSRAGANGIVSRQCERDLVGIDVSSEIDPLSVEPLLEGGLARAVRTGNDEKRRALGGQAHADARLRRLLSLVWAAMGLINSRRPSGQTRTTLTSSANVTGRPFFEAGLGLPRPSLAGMTIQFLGGQINGTLHHASYPGIS